MKLNGLEKYFKTVNSEIIDLTQVDKNGKSPLMYALSCNKDQNLSLEKWKYIIDSYDLSWVKDKEQLMELKKNTVRITK